MGYRSICKIDGSVSPTVSPSSCPIPSPYEMLQEATGGCPFDWGITTVEECKLAGESLALYLRNYEVVVASYWMIPCGCALGGGDTSVHFDENFDYCGPEQNDGSWRSICKKPLYDVLEEATGSCP